MLLDLNQVAKPRAIQQLIKSDKRYEKDEKHILGEFILHLNMS